jgi:hypothetical protein
MPGDVDKHPQSTSALISVRRFNLILETIKRTVKQDNNCHGQVSSKSHVHFICNTWSASLKYRGASHHTKRSLLENSHIGCIKRSSCVV